MMTDDRSTKMSVLQEIMDLMDHHAFSKLKKPGLTEIKIEAEPMHAEEALPESDDEALAPEDMEQLLRHYEEGMEE